MAVILQKDALSTAWMVQQAAAMGASFKRGSCQEPHCSHHLQNCSSPADCPPPPCPPRSTQRSMRLYTSWGGCAKCATNLLATTAGAIEEVHWRGGCVRVMALTTWLKKKEDYKRWWCCGCGSMEKCSTVSCKGKLLPSVFPELQWQYLLLYLVYHPQNCFTKYS